MKLIFIRHGDPDYSIDSLTEKGWREVELLANRVKNFDKITKIYRSPLGRAKDTCNASLNKIMMEAEEKSWLREFCYDVPHPEKPGKGVPWDFLPSLWTNDKYIYDKDEWFKSPLLNNPEIKKGYDEVANGLDEILSSYGFKRNGSIYETDNDENDDVILFYCHLGVSFVMLAHLLGISPALLWHTFFVAPTSITVVGAEVREPGKAFFRVQTMGDASHLKESGEPISKSGYFTDCFQK